MNQEVEPYLSKARESLSGAQSELANARYNNAANRAYYASYQAAIVAMIRAGIMRSFWSHDEVQALFAGQLIGRRKLYPSAMRSVLNELSVLRTRGDYEVRTVSRSAAEHAVRDAEHFLGRLLGGLP